MTPDWKSTGVRINFVTISGTTSLFRSRHDCLAEAAMEAGGLPQLWWEAVQWGRDKMGFRTWWVRAAMARGHAEWLENELYVHYRNIPVSVCSLLCIMIVLRCFDNTC